MMQDAHPRTISFVILTWNSSAYIRDCVESVFSTLAPTPFEAEIFVVDNGSKDGSPDLISALVRDWPGQVFPIFLDKNYGTTRPRNMALARCKGKYICILDSDVVVLHDTLSRLIRSLEEDNTRGLAAPKLVYPDGRLQKSTDLFPTLGRKLTRYFRLRTIEAREAKMEDSGEIRPVGYAISALWAFRRSLLDQVGFLDEKIFYAPEDADFCLRIWQAGLQVVYDPAAKAVHHTQEAGRGLKINRTIMHHILGLAYFFFKHRVLFSSPSLKGMKPGDGRQTGKRQ